MRMTHFKNANVDVSQLAVGTWVLERRSDEGPVRQCALMRRRQPDRRAATAITVRNRCWQSGRGLSGHKFTHFHSSARWRFIHRLCLLARERVYRHGEMKASSLRNLQTGFFDSFITLDLFDYGNDASFLKRERSPSGPVQQVR